MANFGIHAESQAAAGSDKPHILSFATARTNPSSPLFEVWNGPTVGALVLRLDKDGNLTVVGGLSVGGALVVTGALTAASATLGAPLGVASGGTGLASYTQGAILYASGATAIAELAPGANGTVLVVSGGAPAWAAPAGGGSVLGTGRQVATGVGLTGGGDLSQNRTLAVAPSGFVTISTNPPSGVPAAGVGSLWAQVS